MKARAVVATLLLCLSCASSPAPERRVPPEVRQALIRLLDTPVDGGDIEPDVRNAQAIAEILDGGAR